MSTTHLGVLLCACFIPGDDIVLAVRALPENEQDRAWDLINDTTHICNEEMGMDGQPAYVGVSLASGEAYDDTLINVDRTMQYMAMGVEQHKYNILNTISLAKAENAENPPFLAFVDWFYSTVASSLTWGFRIIPQWG